VSQFLFLWAYISDPSKDKNIYQNVAYISRNIYYEKIIAHDPKIYIIKNIHFYNIYFWIMSSYFFIINISVYVNHILISESSNLADGLNKRHLFYNVQTTELVLFGRSSNLTWWNHIQFKESSRNPIPLFYLHFPLMW
jgi:hypothetical protein